MAKFQKYFEKILLLKSNVRSDGIIGHKALNEKAIMIENM